MVRLILRVPGHWFGFEVKGGNPSNPLRISVEQLKQHQEKNLFLFPDMLEVLLYCLFCYKNPKKPTGNGDGSRQTALSECATEADIFSVLAQNTDRLYVMDYRVILAIKEYVGTRIGQLLCSREEEVIPIGRNYLKGFTQHEAKERLLSLGLDPDELIIRERWAQVFTHVNSCVYRVKIKIVEVLPRELMVLLDKVVRIPLKGPCKRTLRIAKDEKPHA